MSNNETWLKEAFERDRAEKQQYLREHPEFEPDGDFWDAHSCSMFADAYGYCQFCGAAVYGSAAYRDLYGGE